MLDIDQMIVEARQNKTKRRISEQIDDARTASVEAALKDTLAPLLTIVAMKVSRKDRSVTALLAGRGSDKVDVELHIEIHPWTYKLTARFASETSVSTAESGLTADAAVDKLMFLIKDKLFVFGSFEQETQTDPGSNFVATRTGSEPNKSIAKAADLDRLKDFLMSKFKYNPGAYENWNKEKYSQYTTHSIVF